MSQPMENRSSKRREKERHRRPMGGGGGRMTEDRQEKPRSNSTRKDRSQGSPANEFQVWNGDVDDESGDASGGQDQADEDD